MEIQKSPDKPKIWGGIECTINRIGDEYKDQLNYSGHYERPGDLEAIAELGIHSIRYPVLWEKHQRVKNKKIDWQWTDRQLSTIRDLGHDTDCRIIASWKRTGFYKSAGS